MQLLISVPEWRPFFGPSYYGCSPLFPKVKSMDPFPLHVHSKMHISKIIGCVRLMKRFLQKIYNTVIIIDVQNVL